MTSIRDIGVTAKGTIGFQEEVTLGSDVKTDRIARKVTIYPGCRLFGSSTLICEGAELGREAPVTINNCYIGPHVKLKGGYFENAVFLAGAEAGSGAHVRGGTILEEQASIAHTVGLKQTILFPFVTLGSLINFCDCLMAGGTSRTNHSEVGSSYIHFNYTPNQDKATASLIGDVPGGVMLREDPIFLGGQGGLVGPCRLAYGTVIAAGSVYRKDQLKPNRLVFEGGGRGGNVPYSAGIYRNVKRQAHNNIIYMANLIALLAWYTHIRAQFVHDAFDGALHEGLLGTLKTAIAERVKRFGAFCTKLEGSARLYRQQMGAHASAALLRQKDELSNNGDQVAALIGRRVKTIADGNSQTVLSAVRGIMAQSSGSSYIEAIQNLDAADAQRATAWLQEVVDRVCAQVLDLLPSLK